MKKFDTVEAAEEFNNEAEKELQKKLCPLFKKECSKNCMSFYSGQVTVYSGQVAVLQRTVTAYAPQCTCALVTGSIAYEEA